MVAWRNAENGDLVGVGGLDKGFFFWYSISLLLGAWALVVQSGSLTEI